MPAKKSKVAAMELDQEALVINPPNLQTVLIKIQGTAPYVQHKFSSKSRQLMLKKQIEGTRAKKGGSRTPKDVKADYEGAMHLTKDEKHGIPAPAFRSAMISACRLCGFQMTKAKLAIFIEPDCFDQDEGTPLVFLKGRPSMHESSVRLETGVADVRIRPMFKKWAADLRVRFDADLFSQTDVLNLLHRAGLQVGIGEGRPDSKKSHGQGWGTFEITN